MADLVEVYTFSKGKLHLKCIGSIYMDRANPPFKCRALAVPCQSINGADYNVITAPGYPIIKGGLLWVKEAWTKNV